MKEVEVFRWVVPGLDPWQRPRLSSLWLSRQDASRKFPGCHPDLDSVRTVAVCESLEQPRSLHRQGVTRGGCSR